MIQFDDHRGRLSDLPAILLIGRLYQNRATGVLNVEDATNVTRLWFKRGYLCHSTGDEGTRLGIFLGEGRNEQRAVRRALRCQAEDGKLLGQHLIAAGAITPSGLEVALERQLGVRLRKVLSSTRGGFHFDEGMNGFGSVPLSAHLANPLSLAAEAMDTVPEGDLYWLDERLASRRIRLAPGRRIPPALRARDRDGLLERLVDWQAAALLSRSPRAARLGASLLGFGYLSTERIRRPVLPTKARVATGHVRHAVLEKLSLLRSGGTWYELLGASPLSSHRELKARYRSLALVCHPDRVEAALQDHAKSLFAELAHAYRSLTDDNARLEYDRSLVVGGDWRRHGTAAEVEILFIRRADEFMGAGKADFAMEYQRLSADLGRIRRRLTVDGGGIRLTAASAAAVSSKR